MPTVIKLKKSETSSSVPSTSDLAVGEIAVNTADKKIYVRSSGGIVEVANNIGAATGDITEVLTPTGSGLTGGTTAGSANLAIAVDDSSIQISSNTLQVKASGVTNDMLANNSVTINSQSLVLGGSLTLDTDNISEGSSNLYYTNEKVDDRISALVQNGTGLTWTYDDNANSFTPAVSLSSFDTDNLSEGSTNKYFSNTLANSAIDARVTKTFVDNLSVVAASAGTATSLASAQNFSLTGDVTASAVSFDGSGAVALATNIANNVVGVNEINVTDAAGALQSDGAGNLSFAPATASFSAIGEHVLPATDDLYDLGSASKKWRNLYVGGDTIFLDDAKIMKKSTGLMMNPGVSNSLASLTITNDGAGYLEQPSITFPNPDNTGVDTLVITNAGGGYTAAPVVTIDAPTANPAVQATATATMVDDGSGNNTFAVASITVDTGGSGYPTAPNVTIAATPNAGAGAIQATATTTVNPSVNGGSVASGYTVINVTTGKITEAVITAAGSGYTTVPTVTVESPAKDVTLNILVYNDYSTGNNYYTLSGGINQEIDIIQGQTYTFDLSSTTHSGHLFALSGTQDGTHGGGTKYTTGVTYTGTQGTSGAKMVLVTDANTPTTLYPYCETHSGMGGTSSLTKLASGTTGIITPVLAEYNAAMDKKFAMEPFSIAMSIALGA
tara:strand:- start:10277 stop:12292 length:2016 start_codon:yes stop_codon:yes gene_type:complete